MTKDEIAAEITKRNPGLSKADAERSYNSLIDLIAVELRSGRDFLLRDIGTLKPKSVNARMGRNPSTNTPMQIPARKTVKFKIAQGLSNQLNA
jgi:nucleoid DNA-binding protein